MNGQTKVLNRYLEMYLCCFASEQPRHWSDWLYSTEFWYHNNYQGSIIKTQFELVYGIPPSVLRKFITGETQVEVIAQDLLDRDEALQLLQFNLRRAQDRMIKFSNVNRRDVSFIEGEWVYLKLRLYRQHLMIDG